MPDSLEISDEGRTGIDDETDCVLALICLCLSRHADEAARRNHFARAVGVDDDAV